MMAHLTHTVTALLLLLATMGQLTNSQHVHLSNKRTPPLLSKVPDTSFSCSDHRAGYYADMEADCQAYHMCDTLGKQYSYLCPNMTVFNQRFMVCDHWHHVNCTNSGHYYDLNMRMAGGGKKLPQAARLANLIQNDDLERRLIVDSRGPKKSAEIARAIKKSEMKKMKDQLLNTQRRVTGTTPIRRTSTPRSNTAAVGTTKAPTKLSTATSRSTFLRPLTKTSRGPFSSKPTSAPNVQTTSRTTTASPTTAIPPTSVKFATNVGRRPSAGFTQIINFTGQRRNQSQVPPPPPVIQMLPGMVARGSGPRFGFGSTNLVKPSPHHFDIPREILDNPLFLELSRQILLPRQRFEVDGVTPQRSNENSVGSTRVTLNPRSSTSKFVFPRTNLVSFPIQPVIFNGNTTPRPFVMTGPRQEDITELEAKRNGRQRVQPVPAHFQAPVHSNQAFFIPETRLIPPDDIKIPVTVTKPVTPSTFSSQDRQVTSNGALGQQNIFNNDQEDHSHDHMTMIFPDTRHRPIAQGTIGGLLLNPNCPECHPAFLTPGKCTPCVRIR